MKYLINKNLVKEAEVHLQGTNIEVWEVGDGIVAVKVEENYDIYFDTGRWVFKVKISEEYKATLFPVELTNVGFIPGKLLTDGVKTFDKVFVVVKQKLCPTSDCYKLIDEDILKEKSRTGFPFGTGKDIFGDIFNDDFFGRFPKKKK